MMGETVGSTARLAGFWRRFGALLIDAIITGIISGILRVTLAHGDSANAVASAIGLLVGLIYYTWGFGSGQTIGCRVLSLKIVDQNSGGVPGYGKGLIRYIMSLVSAFVLLIGYLWAIWDNKKQTWHDKAAGTLVINTGESSSNQVSFNAPAG
jgi:uncharacterized RDD family membrane protein YckC